LADQLVDLLVAHFNICFDQRIMQLLCLNHPSAILIYRLKLDSQIFDLFLGGGLHKKVQCGFFES